MWQSLDMAEIAKACSPSSILGKTRGDFVGYLRDFSIRKLPDEMVEILHPDDDIGEDLSSDDAGTAAIADPDDSGEGSPEMVPFTLKDPAMERKTGQPEIDIEAIKQIAWHEGHEQARRHYAHELEKTLEAHKQEMETVRQETIAALGCDLANHCQAGFERIQSSLESEMASLLGLLIKEKLTARAVAEFAKKLADEAVKAVEPLTLEGSGQLLDAFVALAENMPEIDLARYRLKANQNHELRLVQGDKVISTRLAPLLRQLKEII